MATEVENSFNNLQEELDKAKENLKSVDENIKKLTGRVPFENRAGAQQPVRRNASGTPVRGMGRGQIFGQNDRQRGDADMPPAKRRNITVFSRLEGRNRRRSQDEESGEEDELPTKPTVQSSVVAYPKEQKTRKDCIEEQKPDAKGLARNRRMFGLLMGTLQKFRVEEQKKHVKEQKRVEIERKLEDKVEREKEDLKKERKELFLERRKRQAELRRLEYKMELAKQLDEWVLNRKRLSNFIFTKASPSIYYLPAKHNDVTTSRLEESKKNIEDGIEILRKTVQEEIDNVGKRRVIAVENEMDVEGNDHSNGQVRLSFDAASCEAGLDPSQNSENNLAMDAQEDIMGEMYEESKGSFPMLIPLDQAPVATNNGDDYMISSENQVMESKENINSDISSSLNVVESINIDEQSVALESIELPSTTNDSIKQETIEDQEINESDINKLAEKEFEPIYD